MRRRRWWEPYRRTFRAKDKPTGAWLEVDMTFCQINGRLSVVAMRSGGLPATIDGARLGLALSRRAYRLAHRWRSKLAARWDSA